MVNRNLNVRLNNITGECLGSGGFAKVYKAGEYASSDTAMTNIKRIVALKVSTLQSSTRKQRLNDDLLFYVCGDSSWRIKIKLN